MKAKNKNIVCIIVIILMLGSILGTGYLSTKNVNNNVPNTNESGGTPPEMPSKDNQDEPPEKPSDEMPESNNSMDSNNDQPDNMQTPPEMPNDNEKSQAGFDKQPEKSSKNYIYTIAFGIESLVLSIVILYLLMSKFNKNTLKETFCNKDKIIIYILGLIILTVGLTYLENNFLNKTNTSVENSNPEMSNSQNTNISYSSANEIKESLDINSGDYSSTNKDENALIVTGDIDVSLSNITVDKSGDSDGGDNTSFYGTNSAIIVKDGANLTLKKITVTTDATGANGVFSYGGAATTNNSSSDGTTINISDSKITTTKDNSGGIMTTGGGIMNANNLTITTYGVSSAAIRTDRGGGTVNVDGGIYKTTGAGSPSIYSTANITVKNAELIASSSEGIVIEGKNKVSLENVILTDTNNKLNGLSTTYKNIFLYQSMSGDASDGVAEFSSKDSTITTNNGDTFYITNTSAKITLINNKIINNDKSGNFLRAQKDSWGNSGSNGGVVELIMSKQEVKGNIELDSISSLDMTMKDNSYYEGTINGNNSAKSIKLKIDKSSKIKLTGDSYITSYEDSDNDYGNIDFNGYKLYVDGKLVNK